MSYYRKGAVKNPNLTDKLVAFIGGLLGKGKFKDVSPTQVAAALMDQGKGGKGGMLDIPRFATQEKARSILNNIKDRDRRGSASDASSAGPREQAMRLMRAISLGGKAPTVRDPENPYFQSTPSRKAPQRERTPMQSVDYGSRGGPKDPDNPNFEANPRRKVPQRLKNVDYGARGGAKDPENPYYEANPRNVPPRETGNRSTMKRMYKGLGDVIPKPKFKGDGEGNWTDGDNWQLAQYRDALQWAAAAENMERARGYGRANTYSEYMDPRSIMNAIARAAGNPGAQTKSINAVNYPMYNNSGVPSGLVSGRTLFGMPGGRSGRGVGTAKRMSKSITSINQNGTRHVVGGYRKGTMSKRMAASQTQTKNKYC